MGNGGGEIEWFWTWKGEWDARDREKAWPTLPLYGERWGGKKKIRRGRAGNTRSNNTGGILQARVQFSAACPFDVSLSSPCGSCTATSRKISSRVFHFVFFLILGRRENKWKIFIAWQWRHHPQPGWLVREVSLKSVSRYSLKMIFIFIFLNLWKQEDMCKSACHAKFCFTSGIHLEKGTRKVFLRQRQNLQHIQAGQSDLFLLVQTGNRSSYLFFLWSENATQLWQNRPSREMHPTR